MLNPFAAQRHGWKLMSIKPFKSEEEEERSTSL